MTDDRRDFIVNTIVIYHHCLPDNSVVPKSLAGYISYVYDARPTVATVALDKTPYNMSVNIFSWSPVNLLTFTEVDSLYIYLRSSPTRATQRDRKRLPTRIYSYSTREHTSDRRLV